MWNFLIFFIIGWLVGFFVYYLTEDHKQSEDYQDDFGGLHISAR
jgi:hypothetical protein